MSKRYFYSILLLVFHLYGADLYNIEHISIISYTCDSEGKALCRTGYLCITSGYIQVRGDTSVTSAS